MLVCLNKRLSDQWPAVESFGCLFQLLTAVVSCQTVHICLAMVRAKGADPPLSVSLAIKRLFFWRLPKLKVRGKKLSFFGKSSKNSNPPHLVHLRLKKCIFANKKKGSFLGQKGSWKKVKKMELRFQVNLGSRHSAKSRHGNPRIKNSWSRQGLLGTDTNANKHIYMYECLSLTPKNLGQIMINQGHTATAVVEQNGYFMIKQNCDYLYQTPH